MAGDVLTEPMMVTVQVRAVPIRPYGKARPVVTRSRAYMPDAYVQSRDDLLRKWGEVYLPPPWEVEMVAVRKMPQAVLKSKKRRSARYGRPCETTPDIDNISGWVYDALLEEDSSVVVAGNWKVWGLVDAMWIRISQVSRDLPLPLPIPLAEIEAEAEAHPLYV